VTSAAPVFAISISELPVVNGTTISLDEGAASAPSANVVMSPPNQNPCRPGVALVACTQPALFAPGKNSLANFANWPRATMVCVDVCCKAPSSPNKVNVTVAFVDPGLTMAKPVARNSAGGMTRGKLNVDCAREKIGIVMMAITARSVVLIEVSIEGKRAGEGKKDARSRRPLFASRHLASSYFTSFSTSWAAG